MKSKLFAFFHLNIMYSAIEEKERIKVIKSCYWPLLKIIQKYSLPFGIELSGYTLEIINKIDPNWVREFKKLLKKGICELIGCGYSQIIGPLVPSNLNYNNLKLGDKAYKKLLGIKPKIALVNEQAFSKGLIENYLRNNYTTIITEWENSQILNQKNKNGYLYFPQNLSFQGKKIKIIWNNSINFQKFQRYVHGEYTLNEYINHVTRITNYGKGAISLYGNDIEIFDFRPGRYMTESKLSKDSEWNKIDELFNCLINEKKFKFVKVSQVLNLNHSKLSNNNIDIVNPSKPIPVKKQEKYNIVRWAVSGRNDLDINTDCWRIFNSLDTINQANEHDWRELCYLWSSDFRTHITFNRWSKYLKRLKNYKKKLSISKKEKNLKKIIFDKEIFVNEDSRATINKSPYKINTSYEGNLLKIEGKRLKISFNCYRGLSINSYIDKKYSKLPLFGTIHHGTLQDIKFSADFYSGHTVFESPGQHKVTDLNIVEPLIKVRDDIIEISSTIPTRIGLIEKSWIFDDSIGRLIQNIKFKSKIKLIGSLRLGYITIIPDSFSLNKLFYKTNNGGEDDEVFNIYKSSSFDHGRSVSSLISTNQALGLTNGKISIGDNKKKINICFDNSELALIGLMSYQKIKRKYLSRFALSAREIDDTSKLSRFKNFSINIHYFID